MEENGFVWYACYGSNLSKERFMRYICCCDDPTPPAEDRPFRFGHDIYFAKATAYWDGGGKAFLDDTCPGSAYGRIYKITAGQYAQVKNQEGRDYTKALYLGQIDGLPVYSFTDTQKNIPHTAPSVRYFSTILRGLQERWGATRSSRELAEYLIAAVLPQDALSVACSLLERPGAGSEKTLAADTGLAQERVAEGLEWLVERGVVCHTPEGVALAEGPCARELIAAIGQALVSNDQ